MTSPCFVTPLEVEALPDGNSWRLVAPLVYVSNIIGPLRIPTGFITDFASVPRLPLAYMLMGGVAHKAAVVHDFLYQFGSVDRRTADRVFKEAMEVTGVSAWRRYPMYLAVRLFGWMRF